ncbi:MAG: Mut7-C ubiquitin/RNAse domain-containing protein [Anaerolinea sp.]|nr:Mut7-C ubiquitin/RNAse domain-containing protein [Anaerolinea sp.]
MPEATLRFYAHLNEFLTPSRRQLEFFHRFDGTPAIKDMIESLGVPHTEVALILVNSMTVDFTYNVQSGDRISVYPPFEQITLPASLQPNDMGDCRFVADVHLGRLAAYLRMLGFDTLFPEDYRDEELARISAEEGRILLTRDRGLLKRSIVTHGYFVRATDPWEQLEEVIKRFDLYDQLAKAQRCTGCNGELHEVDKSVVADRVLPSTLQYYNEFRLCKRCGKVYWRGSHYEQMDAFIARVCSARSG